MYCPTCGSQDQAETKFCKRCGANLAAVSEVLSGSHLVSGGLDERLSKVISTYYRGRRDAITGLVLIPAAVKAIAILMLLGIAPVTAFIIVSWMLCWGIAALAGGIGKWIGARGEMGALGYEPPRSKLWNRAAKLLGQSSGLRRESASGDYSTSPVATPISQPVSVTEATTSVLEEQAGRPQTDRK